MRKIIHAALFVFLASAYCHAEAPAQAQALADQGHQLWKEGKIINHSYTDPDPNTQGYEYVGEGTFARVAYGKPGWHQWVFEIVGGKVVYVGNLADEGFQKEFLNNRKEFKKDVVISSFTLCGYVDKRMPEAVINPDGTSLEHSKVYFWTEVLSKTTPAQIKHIWLRNGQEAASVELNISNPQHRTWSAKSLIPGDWEVKAVAASGEELASVRFKK